MLLPQQQKLGRERCPRFLDLGLWFKGIRVRVLDGFEFTLCRVRVRYCCLSPAEMPSVKKVKDKQASFH